MKDELVCAWIQAIPVPVLSVVVEVMLWGVVVGALGVVIKSTGGFVDEPSLLEGVHHRLSLYLVHKVENVFLLLWFF